MTITFGAHLGTSYDNVDRTAAYTFTVTAVTSGRVAVLIVNAARGGSLAPSRPTITGLGLTWSFVAEALDTDDVTRYGAFAYTGVGTPSGTTLTVTFGGETIIGCGVSLSDFDGVDTTTPTVQSGTAQTSGSATSSTVTLAAAPTSGAVWGGIGRNVNGAPTVGAGFTLIGNANGGTPPFSVSSEYQLANDQTIDWTFGASEHGSVGIELRASGAAPSHNFLTLLGVS